jgi:hypothetical protein
MVLPETATTMSNQMTTSETMRRIIGDADNQIRVVVFVAIDYSVKLNHTEWKHFYEITIKDTTRIHKKLLHDS